MTVTEDPDITIDGDEIITNYYYYAQDRLLAQQEENEGMTYAHQDRLMSNRVETNTMGGTTEMLEHAIWTPVG